MKTLKQYLQSIQEETEEIYWNEESIIYAVKEWLTQKIKKCPECKHNVNGHMNYDVHYCYPCQDYSFICKLLLEELNQT